MSDEVTSAMNAYLSQFTHHSDDEKREIAETLTGLVQNSLPHGNMATMNMTPMDRHKIRFIEAYVQSLGRTHLGTDYLDGTSLIRFGPDPQTAATPATPTVTPNPASNAAPRRRRQRQDPIADAIGGLGQAVAASGSNSQWQQNVSQTSGQLTNSVADAVVERVAAPLTNAIRRSVSSSRSAQATPPQSTPAVLTSGNVTPSATFQPFQPTGEVPDLNNPPRFSDEARRIASEKVRLYGIGSNPKLLTSDLNALQKIADRLGGDNDISFTDVGLEHAKFIPQVTVPDQNGRSHPDPDRPARWELSLEQAVKAGIVEGLKFQSLSERSAPVPVMHPHPAYGKRRLSTSARAASAAASMPAVLNSGNVTPGATAAGGNNPPAPPGNGPPNGPPDPPDDDNNDVWRMLLEYLRRLLGVDFGDLANIMSRLMMNGTTILGGVTSMAVPNGPAGHAANLMDTIADYFNVPRETEEATREAQENLRRSIDRLTEATDGASGANQAQPQGRFARIRSFFSRRSRGRRGGMATATRIATYMRPVLTRIGNILPRGVRNTAAQFGQNVVGRIAQRYGIPAATAARFGQALGPAAVGLGVVMYALPLIGTAAVSAVKGLVHLSNESMKTTMRLVNYSGLLSHANANLEVNRVLRDFRAAQAIQGRGAARIRLKDQIENEWAPVSIAITKIGNEFGILFDNITLFGIKSAKAIAGIQNEQETMFFESVRHMMTFTRLMLGLSPLPGGGGGQDDPDLRRFAGREAIFGQNAVDMVDFNRRNRGPRRPVNPNGAGR